MSKKTDSIAAIALARKYADSNPDISIDIIKSIPEIASMNLEAFLCPEDVLFLLDIVGGTHGSKR